ncbi:hypothetical protein W823_07720 [Williamsia sp. D3]|nr:hypothetical protein W823_07720 [Williamsia sp. D3]
MSAGASCTPEPNKSTKVDKQLRAVDQIGRFVIDATIRTKVEWIAGRTSCLRVLQLKGSP